MAGQLLIAYHGCDITTRDDLVSGRLSHLDHSKNKYDWLGPGAYFFEGDLARALAFATTSHNNPLKLYTSRPIGTPAAVGAVLCLQNVLDMTSQQGIEEFAAACLTAQQVFDLTETPVNSPSTADDHEMLHRAYDNAVFTLLHGFRASQNPALSEYQAVRGAFYQGEKVGASQFHRHTHVQIALRDNDCILGWFLPKGAALLNDTQYAVAVSRRDEQKAHRTANKPRKRLKTATPEQ